MNKQIIVPKALLFVTMAKHTPRLQSALVHSSLMGDIVGERAARPACGLGFLNTLITGQAELEESRYSCEDFSNSLCDKQGRETSLEALPGM